MSNTKIFWIWLSIALVLLLIVLGAFMYYHQASPGEKQITLSKDDVLALQAIGSDTNLTAIQQDSAVKAKYLSYVNDKYKLSHPDSFILQFKNYTAKETQAILTNYPVKVKSYFWLTAPRIYYEILYWSLFGLFCNILYMVSESIRKEGIEEGFRVSEIPVHIAKFFYAPICALVIYFSLNVLTSQNDVNLERIDNGVIVLFFILGFFSGRTIDLLNKIKDLVLPMGKVADAQQAQTKQTEAPTLEGTVSFDPSVVLPPLEKLLETKISLEGVWDGQPISYTTAPDATGKYCFQGIPAIEFMAKAHLQLGDVEYSWIENVSISERTTQNILLKPIATDR